MIKIVKWSLSLLRIILLKIKYRNRIIFNFSIHKKPIYIGKKVKIKIDECAKLKIGFGTYISNHCKIIVMNDAICNIGNFTYIGENSRIMSRKMIVIQDHCLLADNVSIYDHNHIYLHGIQKGYKSRKIFIGHDCWLGTNVVVTAGSFIKNNVVCGANSVVGGILQNNTVYVAPRAKAIKILERTR